MCAFSSGFWCFLNILSVLGDTIANRDALNEIAEAIKKASENVEGVIRRGHVGNNDGNEHVSINDTVEARVNRILNDAREFTGGVAQQALSHLNNFKTMVVAGSKGSKINISQVSPTR